MKKTRLYFNVALVAAMAGLSSGCASIYATGQADTARVIQAAATPDGRGAQVGINLAALRTGYFQAWRDQPGKMTLATFMDAAAGIAAGLAAKEWLAGDDGKDAPGADSPDGGRTVTINGDGNTVTVK